jgi:DNA gyrase/topoisomerase IV subunit A
VRGFDLPNGARSQAAAFGAVMRRGARGTLLATPIFEPLFSRGDLRARIIVRALPWPRTTKDVLPELERLVARGMLDGVTGFTDESSADETRLAIELEHLAFVRDVGDTLRKSCLFDARYVVEPRVRTVVPQQDPLPGLVDLLKAFIDSRKEAAVKRLDADLLKFKASAQKAEAVCVALLMIDRVLAVLREALSDAEAEQALMTCMRAEDRALLPTLPAPPSHDYQRGFTLEQARHLVKRRKLAATPLDVAHSDWLRALDELEAARRTLSDRQLVMRSVRDELTAAVERFDLPRRSRITY